MISEGNCPLCERENYYPSDHHLVPRSRGGRDCTETICQSCHEAIHQVLSNKELEKEYNTVDSLLSHPILSRVIKFISKQDPTKKIKTKLANTQKGRGRNG
jgi:hypothetical protein